MTLMMPISAARRVEETCDYCFRQFVRDSAAPPVCLNCGLLNVRPAAATVAGARVESFMLQPAAENAMRPSAQPRKRASRRK